MTKNLCFYSGPSRVSVGESLQTGSEALLLVLQVHIPYIEVMPRYFLSFETFVLFAQAPDEGN